MDNRGTAAESLVPGVTHVGRDTLRQPCQADHVIPEAMLVANGLNGGLPSGQKGLPIVVTR
jgi:hypothetical protein